MTDRVRFGRNRKEVLRQFLDHELRRALGQRGNLETLWQQWLQDYRAPKSRGTSSYPFEGAHALTIPITAMNVDPILARWMSNIHAAENLWTLKPLKPQWVDAVKPLQMYLTWLDKMILKMWDVNYRVFMETLKLGTGIYKTGWLHEQRKKWGYDQANTRTRLLETRSQPFADHVHLANFLLPPESRSIDPDAQNGAPWVAERHRWNVNQLRAKAKGQEPVLPNYDPDETERVLRYWEASVTQHQAKISELENQSATLSQQFIRPIEVWEVHMRFDTTGDGVDDDIVVLYHIDANAVLQATYARMPDRPYTAIRYLRGDGFYGIGVAEQAQVFQETISRVTNFDLDRLLLSNAPMLAVKEGANVIPDEPIFPGKQWHLNDPKNDLQSFFLAGGNAFDAPTSRAYLEDQVKGRTGLTDLQFGTVGALPSRTPATTVQSLLQEGNTRLDLSIKDLRQSGLSEVGLRVLQNLQRQIGDPVNNPDAQQYLQLPIQILGEDGVLAAAALSIPHESIELGVGVQLTATSGLNNKELSRQSNLALIQIVSQLAPGFLQLAQVASQAPGTEVGNVATQLFRGGAELLSRLLEDFDVVNADEIVPTLQATLGAQAQIAAGQQVSPLGANGPGVPGAQGMGGF